MKLFCANCIDCYAPPSSRFHGVDGAFFGTTFPHLLFQCYREIAPSILAPVGSTANSLNLWSTSAQGGANEQAETQPSNNDQVNSNPSQASDDPPNDGQQSQPSHTFTSAVNPDLVGQKQPQSRLYTPRIYGFRVSEMAKSGPRMRWMRMRPETWEQLQRGIAPRGGGAPERQGSGAINMGVDASTASGQPVTTNSGRPIAGRSR